MHSFSRVSVIGLGYIGLPTAAVIASRGVEVVGIFVVEAVADVFPVLPAVAGFQQRAIGTHGHGVARCCVGKTRNAEDERDRQG